MFNQPGRRTRLPMLLLAATFGLALPGPPTSGPALAQTTAVEDAAVLDQVERHMAAVRSMTARFTQVAPGGAVTQGQMTLKRPGRVRFEYEPSVPVLVVADGTSLWLVDYEVAQVQRYPIRETPLAGLLGNPGDLRKKADVVAIAQDAASNLIAIEAQDRKHPEYGKLTLLFRRDAKLPGGLLMIGWSVVDAQGQTTRVQLSDIRLNPQVPNSAFDFKDPRGPQFGPRRG